MMRRLMQTGFSLVELMIAMAIGMLILSAMMSLIVANMNVRTEMDKTNRMLENGRYAIDLLTDSLHLAGFMGQMDSSLLTDPGIIPDPCDISSGATEAANALLIQNALPYYVQGYRATASTTALTLPAGCTAAGGPFPTGTGSILKAGSDVLVVRRVQTISLAQASLPVGNTAWYLQPSLCRFDLAAIVVSRTQADFIGRNTKSAAPDHCEETMTGTPTYAVLWPIVIQLYFVAQNNVAGDGIPTLKRAELSAAGTWTITPLVEGIEYLKFEYGLDSGILAGTSDDNDGSADEYKDCSACTAAEWKQVVDVRAFVLARNLEQTTSHTDTRSYKLSSDSLDTAGPAPLFQVPAANDHFKRQVYKQTIRLMNPGGRRAG